MEAFQEKIAQNLLVTKVCMQGVMTTDFYKPWLPSLQSPCLAPESNGWERCVKRKYNDGSGQRLEGYTMAKPGGGSGSLSSEALWGTMPRISDCHKPSSNSRMSRIASLQDEKLDKGRHSSFNALNLGGFLDNPHSTLDNEISCSRDSSNYLSLHSFTQSQYIQSVSENAVSKKRIHVTVSPEILGGSEQSCEKTSQNEVIRLNEELKFKNRALRKLYRDLEEERCASTIAANEAMAMMRRLQEEKAAALVESRQYRFASEEREVYNQEAIALLKEALSIKEYEFLSLQDHIETYRNMLLNMKSGQRSIHSDHLEGDEENEQLFLLERKETNCLLMNSNQIMSQSLVVSGDGTLKMTGGQCEKFEGQDEFLSSQCSNWLLHKGVRRHVTGYVDNLKGVATFSEQDRAVGERVSGNPYYLKDLSSEGHKYPESKIGNMGSDNLQCEDDRTDTEIGNVCQEEDLEDVSMSILDRVACLEERFACLGQNQAFKPGSFDLVSHKMAADISELKVRRSGEQDTTPVTMCNTKMNCSKFEKLKVGFVAGNCEASEDVKCSVFERVTTNLDYRNQEHGLLALIEEIDLEMNGMKSKGYSIGLTKAFVGQGHSFAETGDDADVYEVKHKTDGSMLPCLDLINGSCEGETGNRDVLLTNTAQACDNEEIEGVSSMSFKCMALFDNLEGCDTLMNDKLAIEISSVDDEYFKSSMAADDIRHLKVRLQALEKERSFMKEAIESLTKENMELKLLQEITQRLQELKGEIWGKQGVIGSGHHDQMPFVSFFKGILSFAGIQSIASTEKKRFFSACRESSETSCTKEQGGLFHLLNNSFQDEKSVCVARERKVKLVNT